MLYDTAYDYLHKVLQLNQLIYLLIAGIRITAFCALFVLEEKIKEKFLFGQRGSKLRKIPSCHLATFKEKKSRQVNLLH